LYFTPKEWLKDVLVFLVDEFKEGGVFQVKAGPCLCYWCVLTRGDRMNEDWDNCMISCSTCVSETNNLMEEKH
jgi:hypothetical protein